MAVPAAVQRRHFSTFRMHRALLLVGLLILGNYICKALIVITLWHFSQSEDMSVWRKRIFNATSLTLIGVMGVGIGHLLDQLVLLARGKILASRPHRSESIGYILRGSLSAMAKYLGTEVRAKPCSPTTFAAAAFILVNIAARFGGAFLGLAYNIDDKIVSTPALEVSAWPPPGAVFTPMQSTSNRTMSKDTLYDIAMEAVRIETKDVGTRTLSLPTDEVGTVLEAIKSLTAGSSLEQTRDWNTKSVTYKYTLQEYRGQEPSNTDREVMVSTKCRAYRVVQAGSRGVTFDDNGRNRTFISSVFNDTSAGTRRATAAILHEEPQHDKCGEFCYIMWLWDRDVESGEAMYSCNHSIAIPHKPLEVLKKANASLDAPLADAFSSFISYSEANEGRSTIFHFRQVAEADGFPLFSQAIGLDWDEKWQNGEIWVAAILGRFTSALILHMDKIMPRVALEQSNNHVENKLGVKWHRVGIVLGTLAAGQLIIAAGVLWCCKGSVLLTDDVPPLAVLIGPLAVPHGMSMPVDGGEGNVSEAAFKKQGNGWILVVEGERQGEKLLGGTEEKKEPVAVQTEKVQCETTVTVSS